MSVLAAAAVPEPPEWHHWLSWAMLALGCASALAIVADELRPGHRQHMAVMNLVHPITALYWGPVWLWAYFTRARKASQAWAHREASRLVEECADPAAEAQELQEQAAAVGDRGPHPWHVANAVSHCGAGCTLGDVAGEWLVLTLGITWFGTWSGHRLPEELLLDFLFAWTLGIVFQYFTIAPMTGESGPKGLWHALRVDTASIVAFQVGLFGWMAIVMLVLWPHHGIHVDSPDFWFQMQVGMIFGSLTAWPVNRRLLAAGLKEPMDHRRHLGAMLERLADDRAAAQRAGRSSRPDRVATGR